MANQVGSAIRDTDTVFVKINEFDDSAQIMEIIEILNKEGQLAIRAIASQGIVTFFNEDYGAFT